MSVLKPLTLPSYEPRVREGKNTREIFDPVRMKWVALTPEEWVRQHILNMLIIKQKVPAGLIAVEKSFKFNTRVYRADAVVYNTNRKPVFIIECKAPEIKITQAVFEQIFKYNLVLKVPYLWITNGIDNYVAEIDYLNGTSKFLETIPFFEQMNTI